MKIRINYVAIGLFYIVAIVLRYLTNKTGLLEGVTSSFVKVILQGAGPAVGALVSFTVFKIRPVLSLKGNYKNLSVPLMLYWGLPIILISAAEYLSKGTISFIPVSAILIYGLLEEIGWRGFLQQELKKLPLFASTLIIAMLWFVWHLNFELTSANALFFGILVLGSWGIGKVADSTSSLLAVSAFHSLNNFFPQLNATKAVILAMCLCVWVVTLVVRKRRARQANLAQVQSA
ncbi:MAG: CPBP family intramembrane glutamic endopeptidase [Arcticibacter sp.]